MKLCSRGQWQHVRRLWGGTEAPNRPPAHALQRPAALRPESRLLLSAVHRAATDPELAFVRTVQSHLLLCCTEDGAQRLLTLLQM